MLGVLPLLAATLPGCVSTPDSSQSGRSVDSAPAPGSAERKAAIRMQLAVGYFEQGQYAVALGEIDRALAAKPANAEAQGLRGLILQTLGETAQADESFRRARKLAPANPDL
ncbi:MAG: type IV pilus biogenesis/stability protein PilW, partial [Duganella sp.]